MDAMSESEESVGQLSIKSGSKGFGLGWVCEPWKAKRSVTLKVGVRN